MTISNYYVKGKASNGEEVTIGIEDDCVFTTCPVCGKEHTVDLVELAASGDFDLYGSAIYCPECADKLIHSKRAGSQSHTRDGFPLSICSIL